MKWGCLRKAGPNKNRGALRSPMRRKSIPSSVERIRFNDLIKKKKNRTKNRYYGEGKKDLEI